MHGKVDDPLEFAGARVHARGPMHWDGEPGDDPVERMLLLEVTVIQGGTSGTTAPNTDVVPPADHWAADVRARSGTWVAGPARVVVRVRLSPARLDSSTFEEPWAETVQLVSA